jgi:hypothetical protein
LSSPSLTIAGKQSHHRATRIQAPTITLPFSPMCVNHAAATLV